MKLCKKDTVQIFSDLKKGSMILSSWWRSKRIHFTLGLRTFSFMRHMEHVIGITGEEMWFYTLLWLLCSVTSIYLLRMLPTLSIFSFLKKNLEAKYRRVN